MPRARRGFTLWEMAMVLVVLAVLTAVAVPAFVTLGSSREPTTTEQLLGVIGDARRLAIRHNVMTTLVLDPESGHYRIDTIGARGMGTAREDTLSLGVSEQLETELPRLRYQFRPTGAAFGDTVVLRGADSTRLIAVDRWSGMAHATAR